MSVALMSSETSPFWPPRQGSVEVADPAADGGRRRIQMLDGRVVVERQVAGVRMRLQLESSSYKGVALVVGPEGSLQPLVSLVLVHRDPQLDVTLYSASHDRDVAAEWQDWAARLGVPLLVPMSDGSFAAPFPQLGAMQIGEAQPRRRPASLSRRRPRFLSRRKMGRSIEVPRIFCEREIIAWS